MDFYLSKKLAYFHIPKTGGTSIRHFLMDLWDKGLLGDSRRRVGRVDKHERLSTKMELANEQLEEAIILASIRLPYEIPVSLYFFARELNMQTSGPPPTMPELQIVMEVNFVDFVEWYCDNWPSVFDWLQVDREVPKNVHLVRLEYLKDDLGSLLNKKLGVNINQEVIPTHHYTGAGANYRTYYDSNSIRMINHKESWLFDQGFYKGG